MKNWNIFIVKNVAKDSTFNQILTLIWKLIQNAALVEFSGL